MHLARLIFYQPLDIGLPKRLKEEKMIITDDIIYNGIIVSDCNVKETALGYADRGLARTPETELLEGASSFPDNLNKYYNPLKIYRTERRENTARITRKRCGTIYFGEVTPEKLYIDIKSPTKELRLKINRILSLKMYDIKHGHIFEHIKSTAQEADREHFDFEDEIAQYKSYDGFTIQGRDKQGWELPVVDQARFVIYRYFRSRYKDQYGNRYVVPLIILFEKGWKDIEDLEKPVLMTLYSNRVDAKVRLLK
jgi:hypothetical protein